MYPTPSESSPSSCTYHFSFSTCLGRLSCGILHMFQPTYPPRLYEAHYMFSPLQYFINFRISKSSLLSCFHYRAVYLSYYFPSKQSHEIYWYSRKRVRRPVIRENNYIGMEKTKQNKQRQNIKTKWTSYIQCNCETNYVIRVWNCLLYTSRCV